MGRKIPYACTKCGARECKLWRQYQTMACFIELLCGPCALADQKKAGPLDAEGRRPDEHGGKTDQIGWLVPAVRVNGQLVAFYNATSQLVDYVLVEEWARQAFPKAEHCDATNFHNAMHAVRRANGESP